MVNWRQTAKITEVANRLGSKRCEKYQVAKGPIIGRERTTREKSRSRKVHKSMTSLPHNLVLDSQPRFGLTKSEFLNLYNFLINQRIFIKFVAKC